MRGVRAWSVHWVDKELVTTITNQPLLCFMPTFLELSIHKCLSPVPSSRRVHFKCLAAALHAKPSIARLFSWAFRIKDKAKRHWLALLQALEKAKQLMWWQPHPQQDFLKFNNALAFISYHHCCNMFFAGMRPNNHPHSYHIDGQNSVCRVVAAFPMSKSNRKKTAVSDRTPWNSEKPQSPPQNTDSHITLT